MSDNFQNVYNDDERSAAYARLEFPGTYYLAYRDLPEIIGRHVQGKKAVDFGCGAGRSTRFLKQSGFDVVGLDISAPMLAQAKERDPEGDYRLIPDGEVNGLSPQMYDLVLSVFTFDNIPTRQKKINLFTGLKNLLKPDGKLISLVSSPEIYVHEWSSFSTKDFPQNRNAKCGDKVFVVMLDVEDRRPVEDIFWTQAGYHEVYEEAGLKSVETYKPLGKISEPYEWKSETEIAPWTIYVLKPDSGAN